jgi:hypothetical protein
MAHASVFTPLFDDDAVRSVNFFNGRLLSGEDLTAQRKADRGERRRLAHALGDGVVDGLLVSEADSSTGSAPAVTVTAGLALDRNGDSVSLQNDAEVSLLALKPAAVSTATVEPFKHCTPPQSGTYIAGAGVYLLTIARATGSTGFAPVSGLGNDIAGCNRRYLVEGVEFRLAQVPVSTSLMATPALLRNQLAYACFGTGQLAAQIASIFGDASDGDDILTGMRKTGTIGDCDVPLALVYWTTSGIQFIDMWAVRRRPATTISGTTGELLDALHTARAEARLLQFQVQLAQVIKASGNPATLDAGTNFTYLPPAAFLPITGVREDGTTLKPVTTSTLSALDYTRFFGSRMRVPPRVIEGARVGPLVRESLSCPPIEVDGEQMFWLFAVRENMQAVEKKVEGAVPYLIVASPHLRYQADARFDVSQWDYANFV